MTRRLLLATAAVISAAGCAPEVVSGTDAGAVLPAADAAVAPADASLPTVDATAAPPDATAATIDAATPVDATAPAIDATAPSPDAAASIDAAGTPPIVDAVAPGQASLAGGEVVAVTGSAFTADAVVSFGGVAASCAVASTASIDCTVPAAAAAGRVDVVIAQASGTATLAEGFAYFDANSAVDACNLVPPTASDVIQGLAATWQARVSEPGITDVSDEVDPPGALRGQLGRGPVGTDPATAPGWQWFDVAPAADYSASSPTFQSGFDQYELADVGPARGHYAWSARFTLEDGVSYRFCGAGELTSRFPIACAVDADCFGDELCLDGLCRVDCDVDADCPPWGTECTGLGTTTDGTTLELFCTPGNSDGDPLGSACAADATCESARCLVGLSDTCTTGCGADDVVCAGAVTPSVCAQFSGVGLCTPECDAADECSAGHTCVINQNAPLDRFDQLCLVPAGADPIGGDCLGAIDCESGLCLTTAVDGMGMPTAAQCTGFCVDDSDCVAPMATCGLGTIARPSGVGTQTLSVCVP